MEEELKEKLIKLKMKLDARKNSSAAFIEKQLKELDAGLVSAVVESIISSFAITQYANFNHEEEALYTEIWNLADKIKKQTN